MTHSNLLRTFLLVASSFVASCTSPASPVGMTMGDRELSKLIVADVKLKQLPTLRVRHVQGGLKTRSTGTPQIASEDFKRAIEDSLRYLNLMTYAEDPVLELDAELISVEYPIAEESTSAYLTVRYRAFTEDATEPRFDQTIRTGHIVSSLDAFTDVDRARLALQGAARENLTQLILSMWRDTQSASR